MHQDPLPWGGGEEGARARGTTFWVVFELHRQQWRHSVPSEVWESLTLVPQLTSTHAKRTNRDQSYSVGLGVSRPY